MCRGRRRDIRNVIFLIRNIDRGLRLSVGGEDFGGRALQPLTRVRDVKQKNFNVEEHRGLDTLRPHMSHILNFTHLSQRLTRSLARSLPRSVCLSVGRWVGTSLLRLRRRGLGRPHPRGVSSSVSTLSINQKRRTHPQFELHLGEPIDVEQLSGSISAVGLDA